nr:hypothetical protein [Mycobacterium sp. E3298]
MSEFTYDYLLHNWDRGITQFFAGLVECFGVQEDDELFILLKEHIREMDDLNAWIDCFEGNMDYPAIRKTTRTYIEGLSLNA